MTIFVAPDPEPDLNPAVNVRIQIRKNRSGADHIWILNIGGYKSFLN
jgi:hypothetical protein